MKREGGEREEGGMYLYIGCMEVGGTDLMELELQVIMDVGNLDIGNLVFCGSCEFSYPRSHHLSKPVFIF